MSKPYSDDEDEEDDNAYFERLAEEEEERAYDLSLVLPANFAIKKVEGTHRKPCSWCGTKFTFAGDFYVYDHINP